MVETFTSYFPDAPYQSTPSIVGGLLNAHATEVIRVRRVGLSHSICSGTTPGNAIVITLSFYPATMTWASPTTSGGITTFKHVSSNTFPTSLTIATAGTPGGSTAQIIRRARWSADEAGPGGATWEEMQEITYLNMIWDAGYADTNVQALTLRQDQGIIVAANAAVSGATMDTWIEFTKE